MTQPKKPSGEARADISTQVITGLDWSPDKAPESLNALYLHVTQAAEEATRWYLDAKRGKKRWAQRLRMGTILASLAAGLMPVVSQVWLDDQGQPHVAPVWASAVLIVVATLVAIDRFYGFSDGWIRYVTAEMRLRTAIDGFMLDWQRRLASFGGQRPSQEQVAEGIEACRAFVAIVDGTVQAETEAWAMSFRDAISELDQSARSLGETARATLGSMGPGNLDVRIAGGERLDDRRWTLSIDGGAPKQQRGLTATVALSGGLHTVRAEGICGGRPCSAARSVEVRAGAVTTVDLELT
jgi:hypothetical protein